MARPKAGDVMVVRVRHSAVGGGFLDPNPAAAEPGDVVLVETVRPRSRASGYIINFVGLRTGMRGITYDHMLTRPKREEN